MLKVNIYFPEKQNKKNAQEILGKKCVEANRVDIFVLVNYLLSALR